MTAEQALIEENKKDPRVRYITQDHDNNIEFWQNTPFFNTHFNGWYDGTLIYKINNCIDIKFKQKEYFERILCIYDIKQEIPPIPEKWYIECTEENRDILNGWRLKNAKFLLAKEHFAIGNILVSKHHLDNSLFFDGTLNNFKLIEDYKDYQEITIEQFKKYVLCEGEKNQEETQKSASQATPAENENTITHFYSTRCWIEDRINYINKFIRNNIDSDLCIPTEWVEERNELIEKLKNL